jgi:ParB family transcriptional regulator, chromosome partitioning protein
LAHPLPDSALREVIDRQLSVRQTEALATRDPPARSATGDDLRRSRGLDAAALERSLSEQLGLVVKVMFNGRRGVIQFHYTDLDQLDNLLSRFGIQQ